MICIKRLYFDKKSNLRRFRGVYLWSKHYECDILSKLGLPIIRKFILNLPENGLIGGGYGKLRTKFEFLGVLWVSMWQV